MNEGPHSGPENHPSTHSLSAQAASKALARDLAPSDAKPSRAPQRKVLAGLGGGGYATAMAVILSYHFPDMPNEVAVAYAGLLIGGIAALLAYLVPPERP